MSADAILERLGKGLRDAPCFGPDGDLVLMNLVLRDGYAGAGKASCAVSLAPAGQGFALDFDSAINAFPEAHYHQIGLRTARVRVTLAAGDATLDLRRVQPDGQSERLGTADGQGGCSLGLTVDLQEGSGRLVVLLHLSPDAQLLEACWETPFHGPATPLGISITTYNKPEYLAETLAGLRASPPAKAGLFDLLVVNNGDPVAAPGATEVMRDNIGGTGGFLTAFAHFRAAGHRHFVIMDDDIVLGPDLPQRLYALHCLSEGQHIGTLAEILNTPARRIKEQGADVDRDRVLGLNLHNEDLLLDGADRGQLYAPRLVDYSGWWTLMVDIDAAGPLPPESLFIKRDDISFGLESGAAGCPTLVPPHLHLAHSEVGNPIYLYFDIRNDLIMRAQSDLPLEISSGSLRQIAQNALVRLQIDRQIMGIRAMRDFMKGPEHIAALKPAEVLKELRSLVSKGEVIDEGMTRYPVGSLPFRPSSARDFLRLESWARADGPDPIIDDPQHYLGTRRRYLEEIPGTGRVVLRQRTWKGFGLYLVSLLLIAMLQLRLNGLRRAYRASRDRGQA
ncbi:glycosyltransferase family 2 protein [Pararhodobacter sp. CCB-MM2]|uniref:glycosyltransferase family 2 protein n=1 Tax=Pararhodobacter sp. CCB-MM2 TaxID=1786003 RepID=UPI001112079D|nr:glycosyltransferase family 2 protein [Pararhodobacter sp. CCB-MM2]